MISIFGIPAFQGIYDNYIWAIHDDANKTLIVVDPGDARPVLNYMARHDLTLSAILITHFHGDHVGGVTQLRAQTGCDVYAPVFHDEVFPDAPRNLVVAPTHVIKDNDRFSCNGFSCNGIDFQVLDVAGHTLNHVAYFVDTPPVSAVSQSPWLFCGDALFSVGCGRLFEGTGEQMHRSLQRMASLPEATEVYCTHEYTLANIAFAEHIEPENEALLDYKKRITQQLKQTANSLPTTIGQEKRINPFLRTDNPRIIERIHAKFGSPIVSQAQAFFLLRQWKDGF